MENNSQVIVMSPLHQQTSSKFCNIDHQPLLANSPVSEIIKYLDHHKPLILIVGANPVTKEMMQVLPVGAHIIRRGTSLAAIDMEAAKKYNINVHNTPGINTQYVAKYINELLLTNVQNGNIAIIGVGGIGSIVAKKAISLYNNTNILFSRTLTQFDLQKNKLEELNISPEKVICAKSITQAMHGAKYIAISLPLSSETRHIITKEHITSLANNAKLICVSEPEIFHPDALTTLYNSQHFVVIDNAKPLLDEVRHHLGVTQTLREEFILQSKAMADNECQLDMDTAAICKAAELSLLYFHSSKLKSTNKSNKITVVGSGIIGLMTIFELSNRGYSNLQLIDTFDCKNNLPLGTTFVQNIRHVSTTETFSHATTARSNALVTPVSQSGWSLKESSLSAQEKSWVAQFHLLTQKSALHKFISHLGIAHNRSGMKRWFNIYQQHPNLFENANYIPMPTRFYPDVTSFNEGIMLQKSANTKYKILSATELRSHPVSKNIPMYGAIEVEGFGFDIITFAKNLMTYLKNKHVDVYSDKVLSINKKANANISEICLQSGNVVTSDQVFLATNYNDFTFDATFSKSVQHVVGCLLTIPNPGITRPVKIHAADPVGIINMLPSQTGNSIYISGGFGYIGQDEKPELHSANVQTLFQALNQTIKNIFPEQYQKAIETNSINHKICSRPMTPDGLPVLARCNHGGIFVGGTNAGGTVQAPLLAELAIDLMEEHTNVLYDLLTGMNK